MTGRSLVANIGIVGEGKQGTKLQVLLNNVNGDKKFYLTFLDFRSLNREKKEVVEICQKFDAFIITVPNNSLTNELFFFNRFNKPILVEKPLAHNAKDLKNLKKSFQILKDNVSVNYPFPYSNLANHAKSLLDSESLGKIVRLDITHGHGHAWTEEYKNSWRSKIELGVTEMVTVHYVNYGLELFGNVKSVKVKQVNATGNGHAPDTSHVNMSFDSEIEMSIFTSYATPNIFNFKIIGTNGIFEYDGDIAKLYAPRGVRNRAGRHITPNPVVLEKFDFEQNWLIGQKKLIETFCCGIFQKRSKIFNLEKALTTYELILENANKRLTY